LLYSLYFKTKNCDTYIAAHTTIANTALQKSHVKTFTKH